ncbi:hypothetical protein EJK17_05285 [Lactobacillus xujianguonis]|uniref:Uncharacterized protein n=1 Tax=Lactobacillus xujianguonis TaxID=2495899 RepID=A0A437SVB6_9LACO|nr:hypothetical protein EJK17_05285 [Lactobacillus xujianguonis]RVU77055.1 hypothetical protein EJK20_02485 [Lactobacillus xujianguonis]
MKKATDSDDKNNEGMALSTTSWSNLPEMFMSKSKPGKNGMNTTETVDGRDIEQASTDLIKRYEKQGFTYAGTSGKILDSDPYNYIYDGTYIHLIHNMPVLVNYVDEDGNSLAPQDKLEANKNNPDQTNNGINEKEY